MIPKLNINNNLSPNYKNFLQKLKQTSYSGSIHYDYPTRLISATDNSIYQIIPEAVLYPKSQDDIEAILTLANQDRFDDITFSPRGGGTGTNGQSLSPGIIIDCSRFMRDILEINLEKRYVKVQPGVILDQLNETLKPHGVYFAPSLSPSNRATIGGMISTDACGLGSRVYGRTSDHLLDVSLVLSDGASCTLSPCKESAISEIQPPQKKHIYDKINTIITEKKELIDQVFPKLTRFLTGYNLAKINKQKGVLNLNYLIAGSEGTLGIISEATLKLTPIPSFTSAVVIQYDGVDKALSHAMTLLSHQPHAIETIDDTIINLAKQDIIYKKVSSYIEHSSKTKQLAINVVQFNSVMEKDSQNKSKKLSLLCDKDTTVLGHHCLFSQEEISNIWELRKKGVGLLGISPGKRKPIAFIEDTVVPPQYLLSYVQEFRTLLDEVNLDYAIYGHVDVGCLHIRPLLDPKNSVDEHLIYTLSKQVFELVKKYNGVMWGEHGRGFRSEFGPDTFGPELFKEIRRIKTLFDPKNKLNPGKIATPTDSHTPLSSIQSPLKGHYDKEISDSLHYKFEDAINCNGNGACFDYKQHQVMCPSYKHGWDRIHSPKGRAQLLREWARLLSIQTKNINTKIDHSSSLKKIIQNMYNYKKKDFSHDVYTALDGCLSCKACAKACPVNIDISLLKSEFLEQYHSRYRHSLRDYLVGYIETLLQYIGFMGTYLNWVLNNPISKGFLQLLGLYDLPPFSSFKKKMVAHLSKTHLLSWKNLSKCNTYDKEKTVIILPDSFSYFYRGSLITSYCETLENLGYTVLLFPWLPIGKSLHIKGFLKAFKRQAKKTSTLLNSLQEYGIPLLGIDPAMTLCLRDEYKHVLSEEKLNFKVLLFQEWIEKETIPPQNPKENTTYYLLEHCAEKTLIPNSSQRWVTAFKKCGLNLHPIDVGCCGMAGTYGHETRHKVQSKAIYDLSWKDIVDQYPEQVLTTGFSCYEQILRYKNSPIKHPIEILV